MCPIFSYQSARKVDGEGKGNREKDMIGGVKNRIPGVVLDGMLRSLLRCGFFKIHGGDLLLIPGSSRLVEGGSGRPAPVPEQ